MRSMAWCASAAAIGGLRIFKPRSKLVQADLSDDEALEGVLTSLKTRCVLHLAWFAEPGRVRQFHAKPGYAHRQSPAGCAGSRFRLQVFHGGRHVFRI